MQQNEAVFACQLVRLEEKLKSFPPGTISHKKRKNREEYYYQTVERGGRRREIYIRKADVPEALAQFEKKKQVKGQLRAMKKSLREMPAAERRRFRAAIALCREWNILHERQEEKMAEMAEHQFPKAIHPPAEVFMNGMRTRSRAELICLEIVATFDLQVRYEPPIQTLEQFMHNEPPYLADFLVTSPENGRSFCWEHLGQLDDPEYRNHQRRKLKEYRREGYEVGKNLILTTSYRHVNEQRILWALIRAGLLDPCKVRRKLRKLSERIAKYTDDEVNPLTRQSSTKKE